MDTAEGLRLLMSAGFVTLPVSADVVRDEDGGLIRVLSVGRAPTPSDVKRHLATTGHGYRILYLLEHATPPFRRRALADRRLGYVTRSEREVVYDGALYTVDPGRNRPAPAPRPGPRPYGRFAVARCLLLTAAPQTQLDLAAATAVSQPGVSWALRHLDGLVQRRKDGWTASDPVALFDYFVNNYPGPGGIRSNWYSGKPVAEQARRIISAAGEETLLSGDIAAGEYAPWRLSRVAAVYSNTGVDLGPLGFGESPEISRTATVVVPADQTVWATAQHWWGAAARATDPLITAWEVMHSGGAGDQIEAVQHIRNQVLADAAHIGEHGTA